MQELTTQKAIIEREIQWVQELIEGLRRESYKTDKAVEIRTEAETEEFATMETTKAILIVLKEVAPRAIHQREIAKEMFRRGWSCESKTPDQTVGTALYRLLNKDVERVGRGIFRLKEVHAEKK